MVCTATSPWSISLRALSSNMYSTPRSIRRAYKTAVRTENEFDDRQVEPQKNHVDTRPSVAKEAVAAA